MELRHLRYFVTLAETLHFRRAAERLHVTQPTLSHQIRTLEGRIGTKLFDRIGHKVHLTPSGRIFREHAQRALKEVEAAATAIVELQGLLQGTLAMGVFQSFSSYLLPPVLREFHTKYPGIHVVVRQLPKREMEQCLLNGELDLGFAYAPTEAERVEAEELFDESVVLIVGKRHPLYGRKRIQTSSLHEHPLVLLTPEFPSRQMLDTLFSGMAHKPHIVMEINSNEAILETVRCSRLATILAARGPRAIRGLHCIDLEPAITRTAAIFWRRGGHRSTAALAIADLIRAAYGRQARIDCAAR